MKLSNNSNPVKAAGSKTAGTTLKEELISSEVRYRRLFESARDGILILDAESGKIIDANPFLINLPGFSKDEILPEFIIIQSSLKLNRNYDKLPV
jgi:PAS domain-containing protein